jgi:hypothetical protein
LAVLILGDRESACVKEKTLRFVAGSHWQGACQQRRGEGDLLSRGQLRGRRSLWDLGGVFITLLVRRLWPALAEDVRAFAGHDIGAGVELTARVMDLAWEMF